MSQVSVCLPQPVEDDWPNAPSVLVPKGQSSQELELLLVLNVFTGHNSQASSLFELTN